MLNRDQIHKEFDALEIRDTNNHYSDGGDARKYAKLAAQAVNNLDQACTIRFEGSITEDFQSVYQLGLMNVSSGGGQGTVVTFYWLPYVRLRAVCSVAPGSGSLDAWIAKAIGFTL